MSGRSVHSVLAGLACLAIIASTTSCSSVGSSNNMIMCLESERQALLQFKQGLVDESNALASWESEKECCKWRGIACNNQTGHVTSLNISSSSDAHFYSKVPLRGEISPSLLELQHLNYLDLSFNDFEGIVIPKFIGSLSQLKKLGLKACNFSGHVPPQLGNLSSLLTLDLSYNEDVSLEDLEWLTHLSSLRCLDMSELDFSKFVNWPQSLSKLTSLTELRLSLCNLPDVNLGSLSLINSSTSLQLLELSDNFLHSSILFWIANVSTNFVSIDLSRNNLEGGIGIPIGFQSLCSLEWFRLLGNRYSGNIEDSIKALSCANNTLETLDLSYNQFLGTLPNLKHFTKLRELDLSGNRLQGSLSESVGQLSSLEMLHLLGNSMTGVITESHFQNLSRLQDLSLSDNRFSMNLSSDWNPPFQLARLDMSYCNVGPAIPNWILKQTNITDLYLHNTGISGSLPDKFWDLLPGLQQLDLSKNRIHGKLPNLSTTSLSSFCATSFGALRLLDISENKLSGEIPDNCSMQFQNLNSLNLGKNNLTGKIPSWRITFFRELFQINGKLAIDLSSNNLSGRIPYWIGQQYLVILNLRHNQFHGTIPLSLCNLGSIHVLDLSHNNISGDLPHCFNSISISAAGDFNKYGHMMMVVVELPVRNTRIIDMSSNYLVGEIPDSIANMDAMASFNLSRNYLTGKLPEDFGNVKTLESLDLSRNNLSGNIPAIYASLNFLGVLDLSHNNLSGRIPAGAQLQSFDASVYTGNFGLCGPPLTTICSKDGTTQGDGTMTGNATKEHGSDDLRDLGLIISAVLGFTSGFWIVCGSLMLKSTWRYAYFKFLDDSRDWIYVKLAVYKAKMQRRLER
ncbi:receptor-like protein EIX1 [Argentina anserina]|uniref:receptor-like protein EIX1 n=1 Tax=Argentina anserina TaxID=57926 RepID=UPI0021762F9E|nr:receptor-like protein EIX1 [Potentilla anserina]